MQKKDMKKPVKSIRQKDHSAIERTTRKGAIRRNSHKKAGKMNKGSNMDLESKERPKLQITGALIGQTNPIYWSVQPGILLEYDA